MLNLLLFSLLYNQVAAIIIVENENEGSKRKEVVSKCYGTL